MVGSVLVLFLLKGVWVGNYGNVGVNIFVVVLGNGFGGSSV